MCKDGVHFLIDDTDFVSDVREILLLNLRIDLVSVDEVQLLKNLVRSHLNQSEKELGTVQVTERFLFD
jgi:hypothetical protein